MNRIHTLAVCVCAPVLAITAVADELATTPLVEEVRCTELAFADSVERGDHEAFEGFLAEDARFAGGNLLRGPAEISRAWQPIIDADYPRLTWRPATVEILAGGDLALSRGPYLMITRDSQGSVEEHWGYYNSIWRRVGDGRWKIQFDMGESRDDEMPPVDRERLEKPIEELLEPCSPSSPKLPTAPALH